jgi:hypothetical protein
MNHYIIQCQEARGIFEPKTLETQANDALEAVRTALNSLISEALCLFQIDEKTFVAFPEDEFSPENIALNYKNKCLHDDTFVLKIQALTAA